MIAILFYILIACLFMAILWWVITLLPLPSPILQIVRVIVVLIFLVWVINLLMPIMGGGHRLFP